jgi:anti-sigma factor RsiW
MSLGHNDELELTAYVDGELDAMRALAFERRLTGEPDLARRYEAILALRGRLREALVCEPPRNLVLRMPATPSRATAGWRALAASFILGAALTGAGGWMYLGRQDLARELVSDHIRAQLAPQPIDIASSDRHTVKPWLAAHVAQSPDVVDLAAEGFELVGGRIDIVDRAPVGSMVYRRAKHLISVTALLSAPRGLRDSLDGYHIRSWRAGDLTYVAVSDVAPDDLETFEKLYRAATSGPAR